MKSELQLELNRVIEEFVRENGQPFFEEPLIGYAEGEDPTFSEFKHTVYSNHLTPREFYSAAFPENTQDDLTVISWALPLSSNIRLSNRQQLLKKSGHPSLDWVEAKEYVMKGGLFQKALRQRVIDFLKENGINAVSTESPCAYFAREIQEADYRVEIAWSERHVAYAAGLGTFGLSGGLITEKGQAVRLGSVISGCSLPATKRPYRTYNEYCAFFINGSCGACIKNCPVGAISCKGKETGLCKKHLNGVRKALLDEYSIIGQGCGFCQISVPCETKIPLAVKLTTSENCSERNTKEK